MERLSLSQGDSLSTASSSDSIVSQAQSSAAAFGGTPCLVCDDVASRNPRLGPTGPNTLCNPCGAAYRKLDLPPVSSLDGVLGQLQQIGAFRYRTNIFKLSSTARARVYQMLSSGLSPKRPSLPTATPVWAATGDVQPARKVNTVPLFPAMGTSGCVQNVIGSSSRSRRKPSSRKASDALTGSSMTSESSLFSASRSSSLSMPGLGDLSLNSFEPKIRAPRLSSAALPEPFHTLRRCKGTITDLRLASQLEGPEWQPLDSPRTLPSIRRSPQTPLVAGAELQTFNPSTLPALTTPTAPRSSFRNLPSPSVPNFDMYQSQTSSRTSSRGRGSSISSSSSRASSRPTVSRSSSSGDLFASVSSIGTYGELRTDWDSLSSASQWSGSSNSSFVGFPPYQNSPYLTSTSTSTSRKGSMSFLGSHEEARR